MSSRAAFFARAPAQVLDIRAEARGSKYSSRPPGRYKTPRTLTMNEGPTGSRSQRRIPGRRDRSHGGCGFCACPPASEGSFDFCSSTPGSVMATRRSAAKTAAVEAPSPSKATAKVVDLTEFSILMPRRGGLRKGACGLDAVIATLENHNVEQVRLQWRNRLGGHAPAHLPRWLLMRLLAFRIQVAALGPRQFAAAPTSPVRGRAR
jgi:hypothetical protein